MSLTTTTQCAVQFCPASSPTRNRRVWHCAEHRWPGGEGDASVTVHAMGEDATFIDGVRYAVTIRQTRVLSARVAGKFDLTGSGDSRLRFDIEPGSYVEVDPDLIAGVVAVS